MQSLFLAYIGCNCRRQRPGTWIRRLGMIRCPVLFSAGAESRPAAGVSAQHSTSFGAECPAGQVEAGSRVHRVASCGVLTREAMPTGAAACCRWAVSVRYRGRVACRLPWRAQTRGCARCGASPQATLAGLQKLPGLCYPRGGKACQKLAPQPMAVTTSQGAPHVGQLHARVGGPGRLHQDGSGTVTPAPQIPLARGPVARRGAIGRRACAQCRTPAAG